jgi:hypothetical protein
MKKRIGSLALLLALAAPAPPAAAEVLRVELDVAGYLCGL